MKVTEINQTEDLVLMYIYMGKTQLAYLACMSPQGLLEIHRTTQKRLIFLAC